VSYQDILAVEVDELLRTARPVVVDQRDAESRSKGQLPEAVAASDAVINTLVRQRRSNPAVLVYCYHGNQSRDLCSFLGQLGLSRVYNLQGGWEAWQIWQQQQPQLNEGCIDWLRSQGFDPEDLNSRVELGMSALMKAALTGDHVVVDALLAAGADVRAVNDDEHHALWFACVNGDVSLVQKLIAAGSDIDNRNVNGVTCVIYAASTGKLEVLKTLIEAGADPGITTHDGISALESASTRPVLRFLRTLMREAG
jgi:rhodanese-related sulfurtransferase